MNTDKESGVDVGNVGFISGLIKVRFRWNGAPQNAGDPEA